MGTQIRTAVMRNLLSYGKPTFVVVGRYGKAVGRLTARTDGRLILPSGVIEARRSLKPWAKGRNLPWQPLVPFHFPFFSYRRE